MSSFYTLYNLKEQGDCGTWEVQICRMYNLLVWVPSLYWWKRSWAPLGHMFFRQLKIYYSSTKALCQVEKRDIPNVQCLFLSTFVAQYLQLMVFTTQCTYLIAHFFFSGPSASSNVSIPKNYVGTQTSGFLVSSGMAQCWVVLWILKEPLVLVLKNSRIKEPLVLVLWKTSESKEMLVLVISKPSRTSG
jgi:hypothetical protein